MLPSERHDTFRNGEFFELWLVRQNSCLCGTISSRSTNPANSTMLISIWRNEAQDTYGMSFLMPLPMFAFGIELLLIIFTRNMWELNDFILFYCMRLKNLYAWFTLYRLQGSRTFQSSLNLYWSLLLPRPQGCTFFLIPILPTIFFFNFLSSSFNIK